jgi:muramoyltetrapeptide carboxypeptidase
VDAVWAVRGGWGTARLLDGLTRRLRRPKARWVVGFSDITALHGWLLDRGLASLYAPHVVELADRGRYVSGDLRSLLFGEERELAITSGPRGRLVPGVAQGTAFAACLSVLAAMAGTRHAPCLEGTILVLEDVGEPPYRIDRLLWQLGAAGVLRGVRGLAFGQFTGCRPGPDRPSRTLRTVIEEHALRLGAPALCGLPVGHGRRVRTVLNGATATLDADAGTLTMRAG